MSSPRTRAEVPPARIDWAETRDLHGYAALARHLHPGALGEFVAREFELWANLGHRADPAGLLYRVAADLDTEAARRLADQQARWTAESAPAAGGSGPGVYRPDGRSSPHGASQGRESASPHGRTPDYPPCRGCGHRAWAHGSQSGNPSATDPCHADVNGHECGCVGYEHPVTPPPAPKSVRDALRAARDGMTGEATR